MTADELHPVAADDRPAPPIEERRPSWFARYLQARRARREASLATASEAEAAPLPRHKKTWRERRWERRRRRVLFEEVLGWILVPVILVAGYWAIEAGLGFFGLSIAGVIEAGSALLQGR